jgi:hypothetical protein
MDLCPVQLNRTIMRYLSILLFITILNTTIMAKEIKTETIINTSPDKVWAILMNFEKYPTWNPFITSISGDTMVGKKITAHMQPPDAKAMTFKPKVLVVNPNKEFRWLGHLLFPGLFDGQHKFELIDNHDGTTTFVQSEKFRGILVPLFKNMLDNNTVRGFRLMNQKLKELAERP